MNGNNTPNEIINNQIINITQDSLKHETTENQPQIPVNNNELVIYQDVDGAYKTFMLSPQQMAELGLLVQTSPTFQSLPNQCRVINTVQNLPPEIMNSGVQLMASSFQPISLSHVNNFPPSNDDTLSDSASPQYVTNKPKNLQALLYRNTNPTMSITEPYFSNPFLLPGTVLLNNEQNLNNILQLENTMNIVTDNAVKSSDAEDKPKEVVSSTPLNTAKDIPISGISQSGQAIKKKSDSHNVNDVISNINVPITLQANGNLLPVRIANGNIAKITKSAASHTTVHLLKTGQSFHSMEQLDSAKLKAVTTAVNSVGNVTINKNYSMFDPVTKTRIIYRLVYPEDLKLNNNMKAKKPARRPRPQTDNSAAQSTVPQDVCVTRSGRTVRLPRHMGDALRAPLASAQTHRKRLIIFTCAHCSKRFRGHKRLEQHFVINPQHRPPEVIKLKPANPKPVNIQPANTKLVNIQPANLKPVILQPADTESVNPQPVNPQPANIQPVNPQPADSQPANSQPVKPQPDDSQPVNPQPANPQPAISQQTNAQDNSSQAAHPQPDNPQPINPQPTNPQPTNPPICNTQPAQEPESADKNLNLFECLIKILDKTTKENRAMVFVQQLETLLVRLRALMPCMIGAGARQRRLGRHAGLCSINNELARVFDVTAGNYTLDMDALKCTKDMDGTCHHILSEIIFDHSSDDCIDIGITEVPCSRTHSVEDWPLANKRVWDTRVKMNSINTNSSRNGQKGGSVSDIRSKVRQDDNLRNSTEANPLLNVTEKERPSWHTIMEDVNSDSNISSRNKNNDISDTKTCNAIASFRENGDQLIGMFTYDGCETMIRSPDPVDLDELKEQNIEADYQFQSSHFTIRSPPMKRSSGSLSKISIKRESLPTFVKLTEQERPFSLPDVITSIADSSNRFTDGSLHSIQSSLLNNTSSKSHSSDGNCDIKVIKSPSIEELSDLNVSPLSIRKSFNSAPKFTLDDLQDDSVENELNRTNAYLTDVHSVDPVMGLNKTISHNFPDDKLISMENPLDPYVSKLPDTKTRKSKTIRTNTVEKSKKRRKIKKGTEHNNLDISESFLTNIHLDVPEMTKNMKATSSRSKNKFVENKMEKKGLFLSNMLSPNSQVNTGETETSESSTKVKRKIKKKVVNKDPNPTDVFLSNIHCSKEQVSCNAMISNTPCSKKIHSLDTKLGKSDPIMSSIHHLPETPAQLRNSQLDATDLYLSNIHPPNAHMCTSENMISDTLMKEHRQRNILEDEINRADSYLTKIHSSNEQTMNSESFSSSLTNGNTQIEKHLNETNSIFSTDVQLSSDSADNDLRTNSYLSNMHAPNVQMSSNKVAISDSLTKGHRRRILVSNETDSFLSSMNSPNTHMSGSATIISDSCTNLEHRNLDESDRDRTDSYLLNVRPKNTQSTNDTMISNSSTNRELRRHLTADNDYSHDHSSDDHGSSLEVTELDRKESFLSNLHSSNAQMSSDVNIISESLADGENQRSLVDTDVDRAEAFLANMHSSDAQMSSNETDSMSEVKMTQNEGLLSVNESSLDSGRLSSLQLLDLSLSFTDAASSQMSLDLPLDLFPYHHP